MTRQNKQSRLAEWLNMDLWSESIEIKEHSKNFEFHRICEEVDRILLECDFLRLSGTGISSDFQTITVVMDDPNGSLCLTCKYFSKKLRLKNFLKSLDSNTADRFTGVIEHV